MKTVWILLASVVLGTALGVAVASWELGLLGGGGGAAALEVEEDLLPLPPEGTPQPQAVVPQREVNFGKLGVGKRAEHDFVVRNEGEGELVLVAGPDKSCSCAEVEVPREPIPPGGEGIVHLEWVGKDRNPLFREYATVLTNDREQRRIKLTVYGEIVAPLRMIPRELVFRGMVEGETATERASLYCYASDEFGIAEIEPLDNELAKWMEISAETMSPGEAAGQDATSGAVVSVTLKPGLPRGAFQQRIRLRTSLPQAPPLELPVYGEVLPAVTVAGRGWDAERGTLSVGPPGKSVTRTVLVRVRGPGHADVKLEVAQVRPESVKVELGEAKAVGGEATSIPVRIEIPADRPAGPEEARDPFGEVLIKTTHPAVPELRLRLAE